jgi:uncharacterized protein YaaQ
MKLIVAIVQDQDADLVLGSLIEKGYRVTRIGTTGGFLQQGNTTLLAGVEDAQVTRVIEQFRKFSRRRTYYMPSAVGVRPDGAPFYNYIETEVGGATLFILDVDYFEQF